MCGYPAPHMSDEKLWARLMALNGGHKIYYRNPPLDVETEVWFYDGDYDLKVWSRGRLTKPVKPTGLQAGPVTARHALYQIASGLVVYVEQRGDTAVVWRGVLNGQLKGTLSPVAELASELAYFRTLGFKDGTPWHASKTRVTVHEYRKKATKWTIHVDGTTVFEDWKKGTKTASRAAALALAEKRIRAREKRGFALVLVELTGAKHANPEPKVAGAPRPVALPKRPTFAKPASPHEAVDTAIAMLRDLHARIPKHHFLVEGVDPKTDRARIEPLVQSVPFFTKLHRKRFARWRDAKPTTPRKKESSWDYFRRVYGSITWILESEADDGLSMFHVGNVSGGGWSCLEVADDVYDIKALARAMRKPELTVLQVFHGGWHHDRSFAFDTRTRDEAGELAIVPFGEGSTDELGSAPKRVTPFGVWLHARVSTLTKTAERNLRGL